MDLTNQTPLHLSVRGYLLHPPPRAAYLISRMEHLKALPLYTAYGDAWVRTLATRSFRYREPHNISFDFDIKTVTQALEIINKLK